MQLSLKWVSYIYNMLFAMNIKHNNACATLTNGLTLEILQEIR